MFSALVTSIKHFPDIRENTYYLLRPAADAGKPAVVLTESKSSFMLKVGECLSAEPAEGGSIKNVSFLDSAAAGAVMEQANNGVDYFVSSSVSTALKSGINDLDTLTLKMEKKLHEAAALLLRDLAFGTPVVVRFHNDADGASGAYSLYLALKHVLDNDLFSTKPKVVWHMHRSIAYDVSSAVDDEVSVGAYESLEKPLLIIIDFGTTVESNSGIEHALKKFNIIWFDHHPVPEGFSGKLLKHYINPWLFGGDSNYTAGFLSSMFASMLADYDFSAVYDASLIGDYSTYAKRSTAGNDLATILDLITSDKKVAYGGTGNDITPQIIEKIMCDSVKKAELLNYAKMRLSEAIDSAIRHVKEYKAPKLNIYLFDFNEIRGVDEGRYPLPGRFASKIFEHLEKLSDKNCVVILHFNLFISMRASYDVDALSVVNAVSREYSTIESAGGHRNACSIKLKDDSEKRSVINSILRSLGVARY